MSEAAQILGRVWVVVRLTFQEARRRRLLVFLLVCCVLFIGTGAGCTKACRGLQEGQTQSQRQRMEERIKESALPQSEKEAQLRSLDDKVKSQVKGTTEQLKTFLLTVVFCMIAFWLFLIAGLFAPFLATNDFAERTHVTLLARPLTRAQYLSGKTFAIFGMLVLNLAILLLSAHLFAFLVLEDPAWELLRGAAIFLEGLAVFTAMLVCFSLIIGRIPATLVGLVIVGLGIGPAMYMMSGQMGQESQTTRLVLYGLGYGLPQFGVNFFYALTETLKGTEAAAQFRKAGMNAGAYSLLINAGWFLVFSAVSVLILRRKELDT